MSALIDGTTRYVDDPRCQYVVAAHPDGLTLEQIGSRWPGVRAEDLGDAIALRARREAV